MEDTNFSITQYKKDIVKDDIKKLKKMMVIKSWEHIPIIGGLSYAVRFQYAVQGIDRGLLRKKIWKWNTIVLLCGLVYITGVIFLLTPWLTHFIIQKAITETENQMIND